MKEEMIDLTDKMNFFDGQERKVIMTCTIMLDEVAILDLLKFERVFIDGFEYKVPRKKLITLLELKKYGNIKISFEQI